MSRILLLSFLLVNSVLSTAWAQERKVVGKVISAEDGSALPGVSVVVKGTTKGANTDASGVYVISIPSTKGISLVFSFVGVVTQEVKVGNESEINVSLVSDSRQLSEVVVTGVGVATTKLNWVSPSNLFRRRICQPLQPLLSTRRWLVKLPEPRL